MVSEGLKLILLRFEFRIPFPRTMYVHVYYVYPAAMSKSPNHLANFTKKVETNVLIIFKDVLFHICAYAVHSLYMQQLSGKALTKITLSFIDPFNLGFMKYTKLHSVKDNFPTSHEYTACTVTRNKGRWHF